MSSIDDFNHIDACNKINPDCVDGEFRFEWDGDTTLCFYTSWGDQCIDLEQLVKNGETCTTLALSPEDDPNCLAYNAECGQNYCIHGDDLSGIISMHLLKDVDEDDKPTDGEIYMWDGADEEFKPFNLRLTIDNINAKLAEYGAAIEHLTNRMTKVEDRCTAIEAKLTPPAGAPSDVKVAFGNINNYSDTGVQINEGSGTITSLNKNHGIYTHALSETKVDDEVFG